MNMYRIKKVCINLLLLLILPISSLSAQKVIEVTIDNVKYPAIDLSDLKPLGAVLSYEEAVARRDEMYKLTPSDNALSSNDNLLERNTVGRYTTKMSQKYQVMRANLGTTYTWAAAWKACQKYADEGGAAGTWRLPNLRELKMIWILYPQLIGKGNFIAFNSFYYHSSTESYSSMNCYVNFDNGLTRELTKGSYNINVRCIRDIK